MQGGRLGGTPQAKPRAAEHSRLHSAAGTDRQAAWARRSWVAAAAAPAQPGHAGGLT